MMRISQRQVDDVWSYLRHALRCIDTVLRLEPGTAWDVIMTYRTYGEDEAVIAEARLRQADAQAREDAKARAEAERMTRNGGGRVNGKFVFGKGRH